MKKLLSILMCFVLIVSTLTFVSIPASAETNEYVYEYAGYHAFDFKAEAYAETYGAWTHASFANFLFEDYYESYEIVDYNIEKDGIKQGYKNRENPMVRVHGDDGYKKDFEEAKSLTSGGYQLELNSPYPRRQETHQAYFHTSGANEDAHLTDNNAGDHINQKPQGETYDYAEQIAKGIEYAKAHPNPSLKGYLAIDVFLKDSIHGYKNVYDKYKGQSEVTYKKWCQKNGKKCENEKSPVKFIVEIFAVTDDGEKFSVKTTCVVQHSEKETLYIDVSTFEPKWIRGIRVAVENNVNIANREQGGDDLSCGITDVKARFSALYVPGINVGIFGQGIYGASGKWLLNVETGVLKVLSDGNYYNAWNFYKDFIKTVEIEDGVTSIAERAFYACHSLTNISIPNSVTSIGDYAFYNCSSLTNITIPNSVTSIGDYAFENCSSLTGVNITDLKAWCEIEFANSTTNPLYYADKLYLNGNLVTDLVIPQGATKISNYSFYDCSSLTSITIPNSVTSIGDYAFYDCSSLTSITIPNSVTSIGNYAFENCSSLTGVNIKDLKAWCEIEFADYEANPLCYADKLYLNGNLVVDLVIPQGITKINAYAFENCSSLTSITIPNSVTSIGEKAFCNCSSLTSITIPNSVTSIGRGAFSNCSSLTNITIPNSVTSIGDYAFYDCDSLTSMSIGDAVTSIGEETFFYCDITELTIAEGSKTIPSVVANFKSKLTKVNFPTTMTKIEQDALYNYTNLQSVYIPSSVTEIGEHAVGYYDSEEFFGQGYDLIEDFVIYGEKGSTAEKYAKENGIKFITEHKTTILKDEKNATYFADGYTGDNVCVKCGKIISKGKATAKLTLKVPTFKLTKGKKQFKVKYTAVADATGFQVRYKLKGKWKTKTFATKKTVTKAIKKLKKGTYQVQIRAMIKSGKQKAFSAWSKTKKVKVK